MLVFAILIYHLRLSHSDGNFDLKKQLLESWDGFSEADDDGKEIVIDIYNSGENDETEASVGYRVGIKIKIVFAIQYK